MYDGVNVNWGVVGIDVDGVDVIIVDVTVVGEVEEADVVVVGDAVEVVCSDTILKCVCNI